MSIIQRISEGISYGRRLSAGLPRDASDEELRERELRQAAINASIGLYPLPKN